MQYKKLIKKEVNFDNYNKASADLVMGRIWTAVALLIAAGVFTTIYFMSK